MKTITLSDACAAELSAALAAGGTIPPVQPPPVVVESPPVTTPPPAGSFDNVRMLTLPAWTIGPAPNRHLLTADAGHMGGNDCVIVEVRTPASLRPEAFGALAWSDVGGDPIMQRMVVLSEYPGDFTRPVGGNSMAIAASAANGSIYFSAGSNMEGYPALTQPNHMYYLNIRNNDPTATSPTGHFDLDIEFQNPK